MLARNQINATIDHRSFADQGITEQPTIHEGYIAQNMEKKGMIADRCEINRQIRADNKMLRELKAKVAKLQKEVKAETASIAKLTSDLAAAKKKESKQKKINVRVDFTPMVDMLAAVIEIGLDDTFHDLQPFLLFW